MKTKITIYITSFLALIIIAFAVSSFRLTETKKAPAASEECGQWVGYGIQYRGCENSDGLRTYQFYNGYKTEVRFFFTLIFTNETTFKGNMTLDAESYSDKGATDNESGVNNKVDKWQITKKERKGNDGRWVEF